MVFALTITNMVIFTFFVLSVYSFGLGIAIDKESDPNDSKIKTLENGLYWGGLGGATLVIAYVLYHLIHAKKQVDAMKAN